MPTRGEVLALIEAGLAYDDVGVRLGIHPGLAYMIATGIPADGSDALSAQDRNRRGFVATSTQALANPARVHNPTHHDEVQHWIDARVRADAQMRDAGEHDKPTPPPLGETGEDADVIAVLNRDHDGFHKLASALKYTPPAKKGAAPDQVAKRAALVDAIRKGLERHEAAEDEHFWPFVRRSLANGDSLAEEGRAQERRGHEMLDELASMDPKSNQFDELVEELQSALRKHVAFEDRVFFELFSTTSRDERAAVGEQLARAERSSNGTA